MRSSSSWTKSNPACFSWHREFQFVQTKNCGPMRTVLSCEQLSQRSWRPKGRVTLRAIRLAAGARKRCSFWFGVVLSRYSTRTCVSSRGSRALSIWPSMTTACFERNLARRELEVNNHRQRQSIAVKTFRVAITASGTYDVDVKIHFFAQS